MKKKIILTFGAMAALLTGVVGMAAFEAHVINVTARIENALYVHPESRNFGTVFPQEFAAQGLFVSFSESFSAASQTRVDTVDYVIKQKPKPRPEFEKEIGVSPARLWCHDNYPEDPFDPESGEWTEYLGNCYPSLCPYLSKHPEVDEDPFMPGNQSNDKGVPAFHDPFSEEGIATGRIEKNGIDVGDVWLIDLAVPCFRGQCAQDWADFVKKYNPEADADEFMAPKGMSGEVFGCDLWVEVTNIE